MAGHSSKEECQPKEAERVEHESGAWCFSLWLAEEEIEMSVLDDSLAPRGAVRATRGKCRQVIHDVSAATLQRMAAEAEYDDDDFPRVPRKLVIGTAVLLLAIVVPFAAGMRAGKMRSQAEWSSIIAMTAAEGDIDDATPLPVRDAVYRTPVMWSCERGWLVTKGDTLTGIAFGVKTVLDDLEKGNPQIENPDLIYPGDHVCYRWSLKPSP